MGKARRTNLPKNARLTTRLTAEDRQKILLQLQAVHLDPTATPKTLNAAIAAVITCLQETPTKVTISLEKETWQFDPKPTYLPPGSDVEFINSNDKCDVLLQLTVGAEFISDPEFVIPSGASRIVSVSVDGKGKTVVALLWKREENAVDDPWEKVTSTTGNGANMKIDNP